MREAFSLFVGAWVLGLIALLVGRYSGRKPLPAGAGAKALVYLQAWIVAALVQAIGLIVDPGRHWSTDFMLPILAGAAWVRLVALH